MNQVIRLLINCLLIWWGVSSAVLAQKKSPGDSLPPYRPRTSATTATAPSISPRYVPPPPNAASLGTFANVPVSLYTGLPGITIPIYTVKYRDLSLPISLAYHPQGVKVDQEASWVGLGWALNAGGTITRTIRGLDDVLPPSSTRKGYPLLNNQDWPFNNQQLGNGTNPTNNSDAAFSPDQINGSHDTEPDLFYYNFAGQTGKFVLGQAAPGTGSTQMVKGIPLTADKIDITCILTVNGSVGPRWEIITADGVKYSFTTKEYTFSRDNNMYTGSQDRTTFIGLIGADAACLNANDFEGSDGSGLYSILYDYENDILQTNTHKQIGAWYLDKIESVTGAVINLNYDPTNFASLSPMLRYEEGQPDVNGTSRAMGLRLTTSQLITKEKLLKEITFGPQGQGKVTFTTEDRTDVKTYQDVSSNASLHQVTTRLPQRLRQIQVTYAGSQLTRTFDLQYNYFNAGQAADLQRLKLTGLVENSEKKHYFSYDERKPLPSKNSMDKDHWGYYNGQYNNYYQAGSQTPLLWFQRPQSQDNSTIIYDIIRSFSGFAGSAIRTPDQGVIDTQTNLRDFPYMKAGILNKIIYPTGGSTRFDYEANTYKPATNVSLPPYINQDDTDITLKTVSVNNNAATVGQAGQSTQSAYFDVKQAGFVNITRSLDCGFTPCRSWNSGKSTLLFATIVPDPTSGTSTSLSYNLSNDAGSYTPPPSGDPNDPQGLNFRVFQLSSDYRQFLPPGRYRLVVNNIFDGSNKLTVNVSMTYPELPATPDIKIGGGLRIRKMTDTDGVDPSKDIEKSYTYQTTGAVPITSGLLMSNIIQYHYKIIDGDISFDNGIFEERINYQLRSSPTYPLSTGAQGSVVGYSEVSVVNGKNSEGGKVIYAYRNTPDALPDIPYIPDYPVSNYNELNGSLTNENALEKVSTGYRLLRTTARSYSSPEVATVQGAKLYAYQLRSGSQALRGKSYSSFSRWNYDTDQTDTDYFYDTGGNPTTLSTQTRKYYDNPVHYQMTRMERESSDGTKVGSITTYPDDYADGSGFINQMKVKNVAYTPIETINYRINSNGTIKVLKGELTTYRADCPTCKDQMFMLESVNSINKSDFKLSALLQGKFPGETGASQQMLGRDNTYKLRVTYDSYDANWNVTKYTTDGISTGLTWDASATFPAAVVQNVGGTNSLQTTYTIDPLLGLTKQTAPNGISTGYQYDGLGRLKAVLNTQNDVVKSFAYHYRPINNTSVNQSPNVTAGIQDQTTKPGQAFTYTLPGNLFADPEGQLLTYTITGLPAGLNFSNGIISGTPSVAGLSLITLTATDPGGLSANISFLLTVSYCVGADPYIVTGTFSATQTLSAINRMETDAVQAVLVNPSASLVLKAAQSVRLKPGFTIKSGATFRAYNEPCY